MGYVKENIKVTWRAWKDARSLVALGTLALVALGVGRYVNDARLAYGTAILLPAWFLFLFFFVTPVRMWLVAKDRIRLLEARMLPSLEIVFGGARRPYLQELDIIVDDGPPAAMEQERRFRVGIRNLSDAVICDARVVLESCEPSSGDFYFPEHELAVMDQRRGVGRFDVSPGQEPTAFVDVVMERRRGRQPSDWMFLCYKSRLPGLMPPARYVLTLRVEGGGTFARKRLVVSKTPPERLLEVVEAD